MMNRRDTLALTLAGLGLPIRARCANSSAMQTATQIIQTQIDNGTLHHAVLHVQKGAEVTVKAFGKAKPDSMFLLGSITKPLTAAAVMVLVDRGEVKLSDAAVKVLPASPSWPDAIAALQSASVCPGASGASPPPGDCPI